MLKSLKLHNFRTFLNATIEFTPQHLLIGKNNSGKTNLCSALRFLRTTATQDLVTAANSEVPGGVTEITNWFSKARAFELGCTCELPVDGIPYRYDYSLKVTTTNVTSSAASQLSTLDIVSERLIVTGHNFDGVVLIENDGHEAHLRQEESDEGYCATTLAPRGATMLSKLYELDTNKRAVAFRKYLASWAYYALSPQAMREGWRRDTAGIGGMSPDGGDLSTVLFRLKNIDERRYRRVLDHVRTVEPQLEAINFLTGPDQGPVPFVAFKGEKDASWANLSDGTLRALALAVIAETAIAGVSESAPLPVRPTIIEEPENGIYPGLLRYLIDLFEERSAAGQFIFTSHSPYFINFFDAFRDRVTLLRKENDRTVVVDIPPPDDQDDERPLLAEEYSMELIG